MDTLGLLLTLVVTAANEQERRQVEALAEQVQTVTGESVEIAFVDQGYTGEDAAKAAENQGIQLFVVKHEEARTIVAFGREFGKEVLPRRLHAYLSQGQVDRIDADYGALALYRG